MLSNSTFTQVKNAFQSISGLESLTAADEFFLQNSMNRSARRAYNESNSWPRYVVIGEERDFTTDTQIIPYVEGGKDNIGEFIRIHNKQPFLNLSALEYEFYVDANGANILNIRNTTDSSAFVTYKKFATFNFNPESTDIPDEFVDYMIHSALADFYMGDGQSDKVPQAMAIAKQALDYEIETAEKMSNNNTINKRFSTYVNRQSR